MVYYSGLLYGVTGGVTIGSRNYPGSIFSYNPTGHVFTVLYSFPAEHAGGGPIGALVPYNGALYGVTYGFGTANKGTVFMITP
jgi:hypothetical protein